ncbi:MAG: GAF domain-containing protein [Clostridia bacterium]|nr:GAF domain-containing protein [Clostridia bacterium]
MTDYSLLLSQASSLSESVEYRTTILANISALIYDSLENLNWAGFYIYNGEKLILGPFCGKPACTSIAIGRGVCGTAFKAASTQLVKNVHEFPGHIACDSASNSEIVVPIIVDGSIVGVLDIDSPILNRFDENDKEGLEKLVEYLSSIWASLKLI